MQNNHSPTLALGAGAAVLSLFSACPAVIFAVLSADNALNPQFFSPQELMHMRTAAVVFGVLAALALTVALAAVIIDHVSKSDSPSTEQGGAPGSDGAV